MRQGKRNGNLKPPKRLRPYVAANDLELIKETEMFDRLPQPEAKPDTKHLRSDEFDDAAAAKNYLASDDPDHRGTLLICEVAACLEPSKHVAALDVASSLMKALKPRSTLEVLLLGQMIAVHSRAMHELACAADGAGQELTEIHTARACRLLRVFAGQLEALQMLRSRGKPQRVIVKHVNVNVGGQAVMGSITATPKGVGENFEQ